MKEAAQAASANVPSSTYDPVAELAARCRFCSAPIRHSFVDLGVSPLCQTHIEAKELGHAESFYPLHALLCSECWLVQLQEFVSPIHIFSEYAYFSSYSDSWVEHAGVYANEMQAKLGLNSSCLVAEIASNDGYLLQHFLALGVPVLGIEPAANVAEVAMQNGIRTEVKFFGRDTARELVAAYGQPDLVVGNNVLAHVPDLNDFVGGMKLLLKPGGTLTMEFPHLERLIDENQFDTIYHEHFSYFSFCAVERVFDAHGLTLFDVDELPTHGGSLRIFGRHSDDKSRAVSKRAKALRSRELSRGFETLEFYAGFDGRVKSVKRGLLRFLIDAKRDGKSIAGYGAPGKGNTLLNYCGIRTDFLDYTVDRNPYKQGKFTPGTRIPIYDPAYLVETRPDYILILPWNLREEIMRSMAHVREWGCKFVVPIPELRLYD
jgi:SAM-dependent methyltransferase